jgi:hypothetical protein
MVSLMEENNQELSELKSVYDELWSDAKTLAKDMKKSIAIYLYAGYATLIIAFSALISALPFFLQVIYGAGDALSWSIVVFEIIATAIVLTFASFLFRWHKRLSRKYSKLIDLEKKIGAK